MIGILLTDEVIKKAKYNKRKCHTQARCFIWDTEIVGLALRIYPTGRKAFVIFFRSGRKIRKMKTIGYFGVFSVSDARKIAKVFLKDYETLKLFSKLKKR